MLVVTRVTKDSVSSATQKRNVSLGECCSEVIHMQLEIAILDQNHQLAMLLHISWSLRLRLIKSRDWRGQVTLISRIASCRLQSFCILLWNYSSLPRSHMHFENETCERDLHGLYGHAIIGSLFLFLLYVDHFETSHRNDGNGDFSTHLNHSILRLTVVGDCVLPKLPLTTGEHAGP